MAQAPLTDIERARLRRDLQDVDRQLAASGGTAPVSWNPNAIAREVIGALQGCRVVSLSGDKVLLDGQYLMVSLEEARRLYDLLTQITVGEQ